MFESLSLYLSSTGPMISHLPYLPELGGDNRRGADKAAEARTVDREDDRVVTREIHRPDAADIGDMAQFRIDRGFRV